MSSDALFYVDRNGKKQDRAIHEAILAGGSVDSSGIEVARKLGLSEEEVRSLYGDAAQVRDARPRTLYAYRKLLNADALVAWAAEQGFATTLPPEDMHVTLCYSREPFDWMKIDGGYGGDTDEQGRLRVKPGGVRIVEELGGGGAVALLFTSSALSWRHEDLKRVGASYDDDQYQPHVTITYSRGDVDPALVEPYQGELLFGPEVFEEIKGSYVPGPEVEA